MMNTILVTADLGHLKAFRLKQDQQPGRPKMQVIQTETTQATRHLFEVVTDQAGQFRKASFPAGPNDRSDGEPHNLALERRRRALEVLARDINRLITQERPDEWFLAAGREINRPLVEALDHDVRVKMRKNVDANLTKLGASALLSHFFGQDSTMPKSKRKPLGRQGPTPAARELANARSGRTGKLRARVIQAYNRDPAAAPQNMLSLNRSNVRRKPSARRTSPFKQMMRKQTISPAVASAMRDRPDKGDRRRSVAQRMVNRKARARAGKLASSSA